MSIITISLSKLFACNFLYVFSEKVVAGINYKLQIKPELSNECEVIYFESFEILRSHFIFHMQVLTMVVWDHFGDLQLMSTETEDCAK